MKNVNPNVISLFAGPDDQAAALRAQQWCQQMLAAEQKNLTVWFFADAVEYVLPTAANTTAKAGIYAEWAQLASVGVALRACKAACHRRLPKGYLQQKVFEISSLTQWADQIIAAETSVSCVLKRPALASNFIREQIDQVLALLALDISVSVVFYPQALNHLLEDTNWRQWRMLPELEEDVRMVAISTGASSSVLEILGSRPALEIVHEYVFDGKVVDV